MKKYIKELIILLIQIFMFYIFPLFGGPTDAMGIIFILIVSTFVLSCLISCLSRSKLKYLYPVCVSILFLPTIYIYYNESAYIHILWYFVVSCVGILTSCIFNIIINKLKSE